MQWGPGGFPVKHPYLAPELTCLVLVRVCWVLKRVSYFCDIKMDLTRRDGRGTPNRRQAIHAPRDEDGDGGKKKHRGLKTRRFPQPRVACVPKMGVAASAMVSSHGHEVCRIPPLRLLVATYFTRTILQIQECKILAS